MTPAPICEAVYWVRGKGSRRCRNRAKQRGYRSDWTWELVCNRHTAMYPYLGPLVEDDRAGRTL